MTKVLRLFYCLLLITLFGGCQHELFLDENPNAEGKLKMLDNGNCQTMLAAGKFIVNTILDATNFIEVTVSITRPGHYAITSDEINGYSFSASGTFDTVGTYQVKLMGKGRPLAAGANKFKISFGASTCTTAITIAESPVPPATFTLAGAPVQCMNPIISGSYVVGRLLDKSCKVSLTIMVQSVGTYTISTDTVNGYHFEAKDTVHKTGEQQIILQAVGKPLVAGTDIFTAGFGTTRCVFSVSPLIPIQITGTDYFPLTQASFWVYDYFGALNDSLTRIISGSLIVEDNNYTVMREKIPFTVQKDLYFRKSGSGFREYASPDKYTETIGYVAGTRGEIPVLEELQSSWASPIYQAATSFGQIVQLRYFYNVIEMDGVAVVNGRAFEHVIKLKMEPAVAAQNYAVGSTGEVYLFYFAKGVGLIYASMSKSQGLVHEQRLRRWVVN